MGDLDKCYGNCSEYPYTALERDDELRAHHYMCDEKYDDFLKYRQCIHAAQPEYDGQCEEECGDPEDFFITTQVLWVSLTP